MMYATSRNITRVIACKAFQPALEHLQLERRYPDLRLTYLRSSLHIMPRLFLLGEKAYPTVLTEMQ